MIGIQEGYNKNFHIKCIEYYEKFDSLWLFWESINIMVICLGYKFSPYMIGIQEGCNKNLHIKCIEYYEKLILYDCFKIWRW